MIAGTGENIANFDQPPNPWELGDQSVGKLPAQAGVNQENGGAALAQRAGFNSPQLRENANHRTSGADPMAGMGEQ